MIQPARLPGQRKPTAFSPRSFAVEPIKVAYSVVEAAEALGIGRTAVHEFIRKGDLPTFRLPGLDRTLIKAVDLIAFVDEQPSIRRSV